MVFRQRIYSRFVHPHLEQAVAGEVQGHRIAGRQGDRTPVGDDHAIVGDPAAEHRHRAAIGEDAALVDHRGGAALTLEAVLALVEILDRQIQGRRDQPADVDTGARTEQHAVGVDQEDPAVGVELAHDVRGVGADDPVERDRTGIRLPESDFPPGPDVETFPVDRQLAAGLVDDQAARTGRADMTVARDDVAGAGQVGCAGAGCRQQQGQRQGGVTQRR